MMASPLLLPNPSLLLLVFLIGRSSHCVFIVRRLAATERRCPLSAGQQSPLNTGIYKPQLWLGPDWRVQHRNLTTCYGRHSLHHSPQQQHSNSGG